MRIISCDKWETVVDYKWDKANGSPKSGIVFVGMEDIPLFFKTIEQLPESYVVVTAYSDWGLHYQQEHPIGADWIKGMYIAANELRASSYQNIGLSPRAFLENCSSTDKYTIKCHSWTFGTFPSIPANIKRWYCTNVDVDDKIITPIPFGININSDDAITNVKGMLQFAGRDSYKYYYNQKAYTYERFECQRFLQLKGLHVEHSQTIPHYEFLDDLQHSKYTICLSGNGLDTHRLWEALYMGSIPIVVESRFTSRLLDGRFKHIDVGHWSHIPFILDKELEEQDPNFLDFDFWADRIRST